MAKTPRKPDPLDDVAAAAVTAHPGSSAHELSLRIPAEPPPGGGWDLLAPAPGPATVRLEHLVPALNRLERAGLIRKTVVQRRGYDVWTWHPRHPG